MSNGFFDLLDSLAKPTKTIKGAVGCDACNLKNNVSSPNIPPTGEGRLKTFIMGEAPGEQEDRLNNQFVGETGNFLRNCFRILGYDLDRDFWKTNALSCRPTTPTGSNRTPTSREIKACAPNWRFAVQQFKPQNILLFGGKAVEAFFMNHSQPITTNLSISRWRRLCIPDIETGAWVIPLYHPSFVIRNPEAEAIFKLDLKWALEQINPPRTPPIFEDYAKKVVCIQNFDELMGLLKRIKEQRKAMAFDYETSGLRPFYPGHIIVSTSVAMWGEDVAYSWPHSYPGVWDSVQLEAIRVAWGEILADPHIPKIAQNIQMERPWSKLIIGVDPQGWCLDTMVCSHVIDERSAFTGLDFQTFINWGYEYGGDITKYKITVPGTKFNSMHKCPLNLLLPYVGQDAYFTIRLAERQWGFSTQGYSIKEAQEVQKAYDLFHDGVLTFSEMEEEGIPVDVNYYQDSIVQLEKRIAFIEKQLLRSPEALLFKSKENRELRLNSSDDLKKLLFKHLNITSLKKTSLDNDSIDKEVLEKIDLPFAKNVVKKRKLDKLKTTYLEGILNLQVNNKIHPNFNLHLVRTYRSSSSDPNFQNLPKRDKESMALVRGGIIPSKGNRLAEADYGGHEVGIIACYSKDPVLMKERRDGNDIHQEWADFLGVSRFDAKNGFVFALFYGSYYKNVHADLLSRGYPNLSIMKVQEAERAFWKKYRVVKKFQESLIDSYKRNGYVEMFHGFKRGGFLSRNEIINSPIQGTAFHLLLWSIIRLTEIAKDNNWKSKLIGQIHDSILIDVNVEETPMVLRTIKRVMTEDILPDHPWIIIPLISEITIAEVDKPWHTKINYIEDSSEL